MPAAAVIPDPIAYIRGTGGASLPDMGWLFCPQCGADEEREKGGGRGGGGGERPSDRVIISARSARSLLQASV